MSCCGSLRVWDLPLCIIIIWIGPKLWRHIQLGMGIRVRPQGCCVKDICRRVAAQKIGEASERACRGA